VRHYTFSPEDLALIRQRRRAANRLGFAVQLAYFRYPGRIMRVDESRRKACWLSSPDRSMRASGIFMIMPAVLKLAESTLRNCKPA